jgi:DNA mismatch endonuclease (patch repair protein)
MPAARIAVFVDGCFWHGCPYHGSMPGKNIAFWQEKIDVNKQRDAEFTQQLIDAGWKVFRFWEHENFGLAATKVLRALSQKSKKGGWTGPL